MKTSDFHKLITDFLVFIYPPTEILVKIQFLPTAILLVCCSNIFLLKRKDRLKDLTLNI